MEVSRLIIETLLDTGDNLLCPVLLLPEPGLGHQEADGQGDEGGQGGQEAGQDDEGGQGGQDQQEGGQRHKHQGGLPGQARVERGEELGGAGDRRLNVSCILPRIKLDTYLTSDFSLLVRN